MSHIVVKVVQLTNLLVSDFSTIGRDLIPKNRSSDVCMSKFRRKEKECTKKNKNLMLLKAHELSLAAVIQQVSVERVREIMINSSQCADCVPNLNGTSPFPASTLTKPMS